MNTDYYYSLCLALPNKQGTNTFYRIADYDAKRREFTQAKYKYTLQTPIQIYSPKEDGLVNEVEIRKWYLNDAKKTISLKGELRYGYIYEVVFLDELIHQPVNDKQLRQILYDGINLPEGISRYFLLVLDVTANDYRVLHCDKNEFKFDGKKYCIERQIRDFKNAVIEFDIMYIHNDELISNEILRNILNWYTPKKLRYFYNSIILPESSRKFQLRETGDYAIGFFSNYLKTTELRNKYSKQIRLNLMTELEYIKDNHYIIERFFASEGEKLSVASDIFIENIVQIKDYIKHSESADVKLFLDILEKTPTIANVFEEKIEDKWMARLNKKILAKENELLEVNELYDEKKQELAVVTNEVNKIQADTQKIIDELESLIEKKVRIETQIKQALTNFQQDIVEQAKLSALSGNYQVDSNISSGTIEYISDDFQNVELHPNKSNSEIFEGLKFNLENLMIEEYAERYATILMALISSNKFIILPEFHSEDVANALSLMMTGQSIKVISIINENYDLNGLIKEIDRNEDRYVLLNGQLELFNESAINALMNQSKNRNVIFTINDEKSLSLFSNNIWNYCFYLNPVDYFDFVVEKQWKKSKGKAVTVNFDLEELSLAFDDEMKEKALFSRYVHGGVVNILLVYFALYKELVDKDFEMTSMKNNPLRHQILAVNRDRIPEIESFLVRIGFEEELLKYYK